MLNFNWIYFENLYKNLSSYIYYYFRIQIETRIITNIEYLLNFKFELSYILVNFKG